MPQLHEPAVAHVRYVAPEADDGGEYDSKADIYSLGKIASELFDIYPDDRYDSSIVLLIKL